MQVFWKVKLWTPNDDEERVAGNEAAQQRATNEGTIARISRDNNPDYRDAG